MSANRQDGPPIGRKEGQHLALKRRDLLHGVGPVALAREAVAMLNADGGEVWIGLAEEGGVATRVEPIARAPLEASRLREWLVDLVVPPLVHDEIRVDAIGGVLRITVVPRADCRPYALKGRGGALYFPVRMEDRIRPMALTERQVAATGTGSETGLERAIESLLDERQELQRRRTDGLLLQIRPVGTIALDGRQDEIAEMLQDPERTGNRPSGWSFANPYVEPERQADGTVRSAWPSAPFESEDWWSIEVRPDGAITYEAGLERLSYHGARGRARPEGAVPELWPLALAELPVSVARLAASLYAGQLTEEDRALADLSLFGLRGWKLRPGSPRFLGSSVIWDISEGKVFEERDLLLQQPLVFTWPEVRDHPDYCGFRLLRLVYRELGYGEEALPQEFFDPRTGRFTLTG